MKKSRNWLALAAVAAGAACTALGVQAGSLDGRIHELTVRFETLQRYPDKCVPADVLRRAQGIILLDCTKAGFGFAFQGGNGIAMVKDAHGHWSPPAFLTSSEASLGFQAGGEQDFYVILLMTRNEARELDGSVVKFGGLVRGTAGDQSSGVDGLAVPKNPGLVYSDRQGFYGGIAMKGGTLAPDNKANSNYYGHAVTMDDILFGHKVRPTKAATDLAQKISEYAQVYGAANKR